MDDVIVLFNFKSVNVEIQTEQETIRFGLIPYALSFTRRLNNFFKILG